MFFNFWKYYKRKISFMNFSDLKPLDLNKINLIEFPVDQYFHEIYTKNQIIFHHTVSGPDARGDIQTV